MNHGEKQANKRGYCSSCKFYMYDNEEKAWRCHCFDSDRFMEVREAYEWCGEYEEE